MSASSLLFVCTGNVYRSVAAAAMLATRISADQRRYAIRSAGIAAGERTWPPRVRRALRRHSIELPAGRSHQLTADEVDQAFLVLGMELLHVRSIQSRYPHVVPRTFLLRDFVERSSRLGGRPPHVSLGDWIEQVDADRRRDDELDDDLEIPDPDRRSFGELRRVLRTIDRAVDDLTTLVLAPVQSGGLATG